jgi:hypothetical protein
LLRRGRGDGTVAIPCRRPMRADWPDVLYRDWSSRPPPSGLRWQVPGPEGVNSRPWCASGPIGESPAGFQVQSRSDCGPSRRISTTDHGHTRRCKIVPMPRTLVRLLGGTARIRVRDSLERSWAQCLYYWSGDLLNAVGERSFIDMRSPSSLACAAVLILVVCGWLGEANAASRSGYLGYQTERDGSYWRQYRYPRPNCTFAISEFQRRWSSQLWPPSMRCRPYPH